MIMETKKQWFVWCETADAPIRVRKCRSREHAAREADRMERTSGNYHVAVEAGTPIEAIGAALDAKAGR